METLDNLPVQAPKTPKKTKKLPDSDLSIAEVAQKVAEHWLTSNFKLQWVKSDDFKKTADDFSKHVQNRKEESMHRPQISKRLKELDTTIDQNIIYIKNYITEEVGKGNETAYYAQFGIERVGSGYKLPLERSKRLSALNLLLKGIEARGYKDKTYGTVFWTNIVTEYTDLASQAGKKDSAVSSKVNTKNQTKEQVLKVLNALIFLIRANHPDDYASELRVWGFQKEKY